MRQATAAAFQELSTRCLPLSRHLRRWQCKEVASVAGQMHVALIAVLTILMGWPDWRLAMAFIGGFHIIGRLERTGVFLPLELPDQPDRQDFLRQAQTVPRHAATSGLFACAP